MGQLPERIDSLQKKIRRGFCSVILLSMFLILNSCGKDAKEPSELPAASSEQITSTAETSETESVKDVIREDFSEAESLQSDTSEDKHYEKAPDNVTAEYESNQTIEIH